MDLSKLKEPFKAEYIEWRIQQSGETNGRIWAKVLAYVTARAIENRLDEVCGPENWKNEFRKEGENGEYLCGISIKIDGEWITKWDGCSASGTNSNIDGFKTALSGSIKRAAATGWPWLLRLSKTKCGKAAEGFGLPPFPCPDVSKINKLYIIIL